MTLNAYHGLQCFIMAINIATPCNPTIPITLINETLGLLYSISTQRDTTFRGSAILLRRLDSRSDTQSDLTTLGLPWIISIYYSSYQLLLETLRLLLPTKGSHLRNYLMLCCLWIIWLFVYDINRYDYVHCI